MLAVTSFSPAGYEKYGRRCIEGLSAHFPGRIIAFDELDAKESYPNVEFRRLRDVAGFADFLARVKRHPGTDGIGPDGRYDFRYDAQKFCRKVFAQDAVFDEDEYVFWVDADTIVKLPLQSEFLRGIFAGEAFAYLGRQYSYTETGFIGFHVNHPDFAPFREKYLPYFTTGRIFGQLRGWHDCIAFDHARDGKGHNLSPKGKHFDAVMEQSVLHPYLTHLKGNRKYDEAQKPKVAWA